MMRLRLSIHLVVILVVLFLLIEQIIGLAGNIKRIIFFPYVLINLLDIFFLSASLKNRPKMIDARLSSILISTLVCIHALPVILSLPSPTPVIVLKRAGVLLNLLAGLFIPWAILCLRTNLTVLPEAHALVQKGPYKYIRHPLYFAYSILAIDELMIYQTIPVAFYTVVQILLILVRAYREELVLSRLIPEYSEYRKRTFWPGLPLRQKTEPG